MIDPPSSPPTSQSAALRITCDRAVAPWRRLTQRLRVWWNRERIDNEMEAYFAQSVDHVDYEYRIRRWNQSCDGDRTPLL